MRHILVTGANKGIGEAIVKKLLKDYPDTFLLLGSRSVERGVAAIERITRELGGNTKERIELIEIDISSDESVRKAAETVLAKVNIMSNV